MTSEESQSQAHAAHAQCRIRYLANPGTLNALFDAFQSDGMPMGSDRWAEYVHARYLELKAKERTLTKMIAAMKEMEDAAKYCGSEVHVNQRWALTAEFQARMPKYPELTGEGR